MKYLNIIMLVLSFGLPAFAGLSQNQVEKDLKVMAATYKSQSKSIHTFASKYITNKKYGADLVSIAKKYGVKAMLPATFEGNKIIFLNGKQKITLEILNAATGRVKLNSFEFTINSKLSAAEQLAYIGRVLRKSETVSLWQFLVPKALAEDKEKVVEVSVGGMTGWLFGYNTYEKILDARNEIARIKNTNFRIQLSCEPRSLTLEYPYNSGSLKHEFTIAIASNTSSNNEYADMSNRARQIGLLADHSFVSVSARTVNTFTGTEYALSSRGMIEEGELINNNNYTVVKETLPSYDRLNEEEYKEFGKLLQTCCAEEAEDCADLVNASEVSVQNKAPKGAN
jgi:hypothetical protein